MKFQPPPMQKKVVIPLLVAALCGWLSGTAAADQACADPTNLPNPVYLTVVPIRKAG